MKGAISRFSVVVSVALAWSGIGFSVELPVKPFANLGSEDFRKREVAQADLVAWARNHRNVAIDELFRQSREAEDPEVRERCLDVLRELANDEYLKEGDGYVGIQMGDEITVVPGDAKPRGGIRVMAVVPDSAAERAGLRLNDLIVGLNDLVWREGSMSLQFSEKIRKLKPNAKIVLKVLRNGELIDLDVILGRRPDDRFLKQWPMDLGAAERAAKEANFRQLLEQRKSRD